METSPPGSAETADALARTIRHSLLGIRGSAGTAAKDYPRAEQGEPGDREAVIEQLRESPILGRRMAQRWLGTHSQTGECVPRDKQRAEGQLRRCAAQGDAHCQFFLGRPTLSGAIRRAESGPGEPQYPQALAWLSLAEVGGVPAARVLAKLHWDTLNENPLQWIRHLEGQPLQTEHRVPSADN